MIPLRVLKTRYEDKLIYLDDWRHVVRFLRVTNNMNKRINYIGRFPK